MAKREIKVKRLISLFEPIADIQPEEKQRRASIQNTPEELGDISRKEESGTSETTVRVTSESPHGKDKTTNDREVTNTQPPTNVSSGDLHANNVEQPKHMEKPKRIKDLKELLKISTNDNDRLRSELQTLKKKLESVENAFDAYKKERKMQTEKPVPPESFNESTSRLVQDSEVDRDELKAAKEESAKERQTRVAMEKKLRIANNRILDLIKKLKEKDKEILAYKADREDLMKEKEDVKEEKRIPTAIASHSSEANEQQSDAVTKKASENDVAKDVQKRQSRPETAQEFHALDIELIQRQVHVKRKISSRPSIKTALQIKSLDFDSDFQIEAELEKDDGTDRTKTVESAPVSSLAFPEFSDVSHPIPNLYSGFNRPKRKKRHEVRSSHGSLARNDEQLLVFYV